MGRRHLKRHQRVGIFKAGHPRIDPSGPKEDHNYAIPAPPAPPAPPVQNEEPNACRWQRRLTQDEFARVVKVGPAGLYKVPDADGHSGNVKILRPKPSPPSQCEEYLQQPNEGPGEMRLLNSDLNLAMYNQVIMEHASQGAACRIPQFTIVKEMKVGVCWKQSLGCNRCDYRSGMFKLYKDIPTPGKKGRRAAAPNAALQVGLQDSAIGSTKARVLLAAMDTPPPTRTAMRKMSNRVAAATSTLNKEDMSRRLQQCRETNVLRGLPHEAPINASVDVRYDTNTFGSRNKMGQNATQAVGLLIEQQTDKQQIVSMHLDNKLCWVGSWLRRQGFDVECPGGHPDCTATISPYEPMSERRIGECLGKCVSLEEILIKHVTTDGDGRSAEGIAEAMKQLRPLWKVIRQADTTHLGHGVFTHTLKASFSNTMFPARTKVNKKEQQKLLGLDLKTRTHMIYTGLYKKHGGYIPAIILDIPKVLEATVRCYGGDCSQCRAHSVVCSGGKKRNWWSRSQFFRTLGLKKFHMSQADQQILKELLKLRIGESALQSTRFNMNTNKNEGSNRGISASLPKNVNFARNAVGRAHSVVHRLNYGIGESLVRKLEAIGSPITKGGRVARAVYSMQIENRYQQEYAKSNRARRNRAIRKAAQIKAFYKAKRVRQQRDNYIKSQLDPKPAIPKKRLFRPRRKSIALYRARRRQDHIYSIHM